MTDPRECERLLSRWIDDWRLRGIGYWIIEAGDRSRPIGWAGIRFISAGTEALLNMAYRIHAPYWGQGIASRAASGAREVARKRYPEVPVIARVATDNTASVRVAEKAGLTVVGLDRWDWQLFADRSIDIDLLERLPAP